MRRLEDLHWLAELIQSGQLEQHAELDGLFLRYAHAAAPCPDQSASLAYRLTNLFLDGWNL